MTTFGRVSRALAIGLVAIASSDDLLQSAERIPRPIPAAAADPEADNVEMFAAMESGQLEVKLIPHDSRGAKLLVHNRSEQPLNVRLPQGFVGLPVLAQLGGGRGGGGLGGGLGGGGGGQALGGGGLGGGGGGLGGGGFGGGFFHVPAERVAHVEVECVCLEHGKKEPRPGMDYEIKPISAFTGDPRVHHLLKAFADHQMPHRVAQAAAWHLSSNMTWEQLAAEQVRRVGGFGTPYFTPAELEQALAAVQVVTQLARAAEAAEDESLRHQPRGVAESPRSPNELP